jgi:hypothetical protein
LNTTYRNNWKKGKGHAFSIKRHDSVNIIVKKIVDNACANIIKVDQTSKGGLGHLFECFGKESRDIFEMDRNGQKTT